MKQSNDKSLEQAGRPRRTGLTASALAAGFPSPADDHAEDRLDLNSLLIKRPAATFFVRVSGDSMLGRGVHDGDLLVVDRSLEACDGSVVIAVVDGELTVKELRRRNGRVWLAPANSEYPAAPPETENEIHLWGVATCVIHSL